IRAEATRNRAAREARATAAAAAAAGTARERVSEAWLLTEDPARMQQSTDAAIAALRRADETIANEPLSDETRAGLAAARPGVEDLARHTRLLIVATANRWRLADDLNGQNARRARADFCNRQREAFAQFGLDPLTEPPDQAARRIAASRLRDPMIG